jgi:hypothetical protein
MNRQNRENRQPGLLALALKFQRMWLSSAWVQVLMRTRRNTQAGISALAEVTAHQWLQRTLQAPVTTSHEKKSFGPNPLVVDSVSDQQQSLRWLEASGIQALGLGTINTRTGSRNEQLQCWQRTSTCRTKERNTGLALVHIA